MKNFLEYKGLSTSIYGRGFHRLFMLFINKFDGFLRAKNSTLEDCKPLIDVKTKINVKPVRC